jgi:hypothetical protein
MFRVEQGGIQGIFRVLFHVKHKSGTLPGEVSLSRARPTVPHGTGFQFGTVSCEANKADAELSYYCFT